MTSEQAWRMEALDIALQIGKVVNGHNGGSVGLALQSVILAMETQAPGFVNSMIEALKASRPQPMGRGEGIA